MTCRQARNLYSGMRVDWGTGEGLDEIVERANSGIHVEWREGMGYRVQHRRPFYLSRWVGKSAALATYLILRDQILSSPAATPSCGSSLLKRAGTADVSPDASALSSLSAAPVSPPRAHIPADDAATPATSAASAAGDIPLSSAALIPGVA